MMTSSDDRFNLYVKWSHTVFLTQDRLKIQAFKQQLELVLGLAESRSVTLVALCELAESYPQVFQWTLHNYDAALYAEFGRNITAYAIRALLDGGCIPGKDFSQLAGGCLVMLPALKTQLLQNQSAFLSALMQEFLQTPTSLTGNPNRPCCTHLREEF